MLASIGEWRLPMAPIVSAESWAGELERSGEREEVDEPTSSVAQAVPEMWSLIDWFIFISQVTAVVDLVGKLFLGL